MNELIFCGLGFVALCFAAFTYMQKENTEYKLILAALTTMRSEMNKSNDLASEASSRVLHQKMGFEKMNQEMEELRNSKKKIEITFIEKRPESKPPQKRTKTKQRN